MTLTANEQYFLELVNRARLDPLAEAARYGIDLNEGLAPGTLNGLAKQVLAPNALLDAAAEAHSAWMLQTDIFSHTGVNGSDPGQRMTSAGYAFTGSWTWGENFAWSGTTGTIDLTAAIDGHHRGLFLSHGHRENIENGAFREIGIAQVAGQFFSNGVNWNASMATQNFATSGTAVFLTGVVYTDSDTNQFYSIGEGVAGASFTINAANTASQAAGGYALATSAANASVTVQHGAMISVVQIDLTGGNGKLDLVDGDHFLASATLKLISGVADAGLLGVAALGLTGNNAANDLAGNSGNNRVNGAGGADAVVGGAGNDRILGGGGADRLGGGVGIDVLTGSTGADRFVMNNGDGKEKVTDFTLAQNDRLVFDDALWGNVAQTAAQVVNSFAHVVVAGVTFDFGGGDVMTLVGLTSTVGLAGQIEFI